MVRNSAIVIVCIALIAILLVYVLIFENYRTGRYSSGSGLVVSHVVYDQARSPKGLAYYIMNVNVTYSGIGGAWYFNPLNFQILTTSSNTYGPIDSSTLRPVITEMQTALLGSGQETFGQLVFSLPVGQNPTQLKYRDQFVTTNTSVPNISAWLSVISGVDINYTTSGIQGKLNVTARIQNATTIFYSGNVMAIQVTVNGTKTSPLSSVQVSSILVNTTGFGNSIVSPSPPFSMPNLHRSDSFLLLLRIPKYSYGGVLHIKLYLSHQ